MLLSKNDTIKLWSAFLIIISQFATLWKTVIYFWYGYGWISDDVKNLTPGAILCYIIPNSLWIIFPLITVLSLSRTIIQIASHKMKTT